MKFANSKTVKSALVSILLAMAIAGCSSPEQKAQKYYEKGMSLIETEPEKAKLEFQNALQIKKEMVSSIYGLALVAERQSDWKGSFVLLNEVIQLDPKNIDAHVKLGQIYLAGGQATKSLEMCNKALELDKGNVSAQVLYASIQLKENNKQLAIDTALAALAKEPGNPDAYTVLATERIMSQDTGKALEYLNKGLEKNEKNLSLQLIKIKVLENTKQFDTVEKTYQQIIGLYPDAPSLKKSLAQFYFNQGNKDAAQAQLQKIVDQNPQDLTAKLELVKFVMATKTPADGRKMLEAMANKEPQNFPLSFALVNLYQSQNDLPAADALLQKIVANAGDKEEGLKAKMMVATQHIRNNKIPEGRKLIDEVIKVDPRFEDALMLKAGLQIDDKKYDEAVSDLRTLLRDKPNSSQAQFLLARAHELSGSAQLADENYVKALESSKYAPIYVVSYAQSLIKRQQADRAEKVLETSLKNNPRSKDVLIMLAQSKIAKEDWAGAQQLADQAKGLGNNDVVSEQITGALLARKNDFDGSVDAFKRAHKAAPRDIQPVVSAVKVLLQSKRHNEAIAFLDSVLNDDPDNFEVALLKGQVHAMAGDTSKSVEIFKQIIVKNPKNAAGYQQLAVAQLRANNVKEAQSTVDTGLQAVPNNFALNITQANIHELAGDFDAAINTYETILKTNPNAEIVINNLASLITDNKTDLDSLNRAYDLSQKLKDKQVPQFMDTVGWTSYRVGKYDEAIKALKSLVNLAPENGMYHYHLGKAYLAKKREGLAKESLQKAVDLAKGQQAPYVADANELLKTL